MEVRFLLLQIPVYLMPSNGKLQFYFVFLLLPSPSIVSWYFPSHYSTAILNKLCNLIVPFIRWATITTQSLSISLKFSFFSVGSVMRSIFKCGNNGRIMSSGDYKDHKWNWHCGRVHGSYCFDRNN